MNIGPGRRTGFTLIELVVVIAVVLLLAGLALSVGVAVVEQSERRQTQATLALLDTAVKEWEVVSDRKLTWWEDADDPGSPAQYDVHSSTDDVLIISEVLSTVARPAAVQRIIARIDPQSVYSYRVGDTSWWLRGEPLESRFVGSITVLDAWGAPIYATHPGRPHRPGSDALPPDPDGTNHTRNERDYGTAPSREVVFVSAGPDGLFGTYGEAPPSLPYGDIAAWRARVRTDNVYSKPVTWPKVSYGY